MITLYSRHANHYYLSALPVFYKIRRQTAFWSLKSDQKPLAYALPFQ